MAISRQAKESQVAELVGLLQSAGLTVFAHYNGVNVKELQTLRRSARQADVHIKVIKNRLMRVALAQVEALKDVDTSAFTGQLLYAIGTDEVAPAQTLAAYAKQNEALKMAGGINAAGLLLSETDVKALAALPSKDQLRAQLVGTLAAPLTGFVHVLAGNVRGVLNVLNARAQVLEQ